MVQTAFDLIDVGNGTWDNEIEVFHNLGDGSVLQSGKPMERSRIAGHQVLDAACCVKLIRPLASR